MGFCCHSALPVCFYDLVDHRLHMEVTGWHNAGLSTGVLDSMSNNRSNRSNRRTGKALT